MLATYARIAGLLYLTIIVCAGFSEGVVRGSLVVAGDAEATAANIRASEWLFRAGFVTDLIAFLSDAALAVVLFLLLEPVHRGLSLVAAAFRFAQATILGLNMVHHFGALLLVDEAAGPGAFSPEQIDALVLLTMEVHRHGYLIGQMFFGVHCLVLGYLIVRARYLPSPLGALMAVAGVGYLADGLVHFLAPGWAPLASPVFIAPVVVAEVTLCLWLLARGGHIREPPQPAG